VEGKLYEVGIFGPPYPVAYVMSTLQCVLNAAACLVTDTRY